MVKHTIERLTAVSVAAHCVTCTAGSESPDLNKASVLHWAADAQIREMVFALSLKIVFF